MVTKSLFVGFGKWSKEKKPTLSLSPFSCGCVSIVDLTTSSSGGGHCSTDILSGAYFHLLLTRKRNRTRSYGARAEIQIQLYQSQTVFPWASDSPSEPQFSICKTVAILISLRVFGKRK